MKHRHNKKKCIIYPEERAREVWDFVVINALLIACISTPIDIAFTKETVSIFDNMLSFIIDCIFAADIII